MLLRVTGQVLRVDAREGVSRATGKPWRIPFCAVLIGQQGVAEVNLPDERAVMLEPMQDVDWLVEAEPQGRYLSVRFVAPFPFSASNTVRPMFTDDAEGVPA